MFEVREVLRLWLAGEGLRSIERLSQVDRKTVRRYVEAAVALGLDRGVVRVNDRVLNAAGAIQPAELRSLDAIHLATAQQLGDDLSRIVTYDDRMAADASALGWT